MYVRYEGFEPPPELSMSPALRQRSLTALLLVS